MTLSRRFSRAPLLPVALLIVLLGLGALAITLFAADENRQGALGKVVLPTSARSEEAQAHFLRGVAALHSFWYPAALNEFRAATRIEPGFMMGYWGEAMAHNHPIWGDPQETEAARKVLARIRITPELTPRERAYLRAVQVLYGEGDKPVRDRKYAEAMEAVYREYPDDLEAATFYSLALLGTVRPGDPTALRTRMQAAAIAQAVYRQEPNHPGAAHYILHAFDDPDHASMAAAFVVETEQWDAAEELLPSSPRKAAASRATPGPNPYQAFASLAQAPAVFARGMAAAMNGSPAAQESIAALRAIRQKKPPPGAEGSSEESIGAVLQIQEAAEIQELAIAAAASAAKERWDEATRTLKQATALEEAMPPPPGPPSLIKPSHELFGDILLRAGRPHEAGQQFARSLFRHPDRARSLLGAARAAARRGDQEAAVETYTKLLRQWQPGDAPLPELKEAREYLKRAGP